MALSHVSSSIQHPLLWSKCRYGILFHVCVISVTLCDRYIEVIWNMLKPGAVWINQGPLLYHWATGDNTDDRYDQSIEVSSATFTCS